MTCNAIQWTLDPIPGVPDWQGQGGSKAASNKVHRAAEGDDVSLTLMLHLVLAGDEQGGWQVRPSSLGSCLL